MLETFKNRSIGRQNEWKTKTIVSLSWDTLKVLEKKKKNGPVFLREEGKIMTVNWRYSFQDKNIEVRFKKK